MAIVKVVPMPGPSGKSAYEIAVDNGFEGTEQEWLDSLGSGTPFVALPDFLTYTEGRDHLPTINNNFGWDAEGLWFGNTGMGGTSYPVFTNFTIGENDAVTVEFNVNVADECSDVGLCVYLDGDAPLWQWGTDSSRIAAQFDCQMPILLGIEEDYQGERSNIPGPGMYHIRFTYNPIGGTPVQFEYFQGTTTETLISSLTLNQTLGTGSYRVGFASDNSGSRTYISDLSIMVNEDTPYTDTLQNGNSGDYTDIADFVFNYDGEQSTMTIHNHDMRIQTTRDEGQDSDIDINSADDVWITAFDTIELTSTDDEVRIITGPGGEHQWSFTSIGTIELPTLNSSINSGVDGTVIVDSRTATFYNNYQDANIGIQTNTSVVLAVTADTSWFASYTFDTANPATITFADSTTVQTTNVYDGTSQGTAGVIFQWSGELTKTFEETYPLTITGNTYDPNNYVGIRANGAEWVFESNGEIKFPTQASNQRTGSGEVLKFGNNAQQSIITGSKPTLDNPTAQRLVVAGQDGLQGTAYDGEGGDIYLWAGQGGGSTGSGGDIKVDAGTGTLNGGGGTIKVRGGYSVNSNGGFVEVTAGDSSTGSGGNVTITAGNNQSAGEAVGGSVNIYAGGSADANSGGSINLETYQNGKIVLSGAGGEFLNNSSDPDNQIATLGDIPSLSTGDITFSGVQIIGAGTAAGDESGNGTIQLVPDADLATDQYLIIDPTSPNHIHIRAGGTQDASTADLFLGGEKNKVQISDQYSQVQISTKQGSTTNEYQNLNTEISTQFIISSTTPVDYGYIVNVNGTPYVVDSVNDDTPEVGLRTLTASGAQFDPNGWYEFTYQPDGTHNWTFGSNGLLLGPAQGFVQVTGFVTPQTYDLALNADASVVLYGNNGEFLNNPNVAENQIATIGDVANYAPVETSFTVNGGTTATQPTFDGAPLFSGTYVKIGPQVHFQIQVDMDNITSFGTGQYYVDLPFDAKYGYQFKEGCLHDISTSNQFAIGGHVAIGTNRLYLTYTGSNGQDEMFTHNTPVALNVADNFHIAGTYITA